MHGRCMEPIQDSSQVWNMIGKIEISKFKKFKLSKALKKATETPEKAQHFLF